MNSIDKMIRDIIMSTGYTFKDEQDVPTVISLQDTVDLIVKKYGDNWRKNPECVCTVIWNSSNFTVEHVKQVVPDLFYLCMEYRDHGTVHQTKLPENFYLIAFEVITPGGE